MEKYYIMINGEQQGPFTAKEIEDKGFPTDSFIYNKGLRAWKKISEVTGFLSPNTEKDIKPEDTPKLTTDKSDFKSKKKAVGATEKVKITNWYLKVLKKVFSFFTYGILWWIQYILGLAIYAGLTHSNPLHSRSMPVLLALICFYTSYILLKKTHKIHFIKSFFNKD